MPVKTNNGGNSKKKAPTRKPKTANKPTPSRTPPALVEQVCSITDPFCGAAKRAKWPDGSARTSLNYPVHSRDQLGTDANGAGSVLLVPSYTQSPISQSFSITGDTAVFNTLGAVTRLSGPSGYRIVSMGVKIRGISAPLYRSGMIRIRGLNTESGSTISPVAMSAYRCDFYQDIPLADCHEVAVVARRTDDTSYLFRPPSETTPTSAVTDWVSPGFGPVVISITGGPASVVVADIEVFLNMEVTFENAEPLSLLETSAPRFNPTLTHAAKEVTSTMSGVFMHGAKQVAAHVAAAAVRALMARSGLGRLAIAVD